jgi:hypothetical protein
MVAGPTALRCALLLGPVQVGKASGLWWKRQPSGPAGQWGRASVALRVRLAAKRNLAPAKRGVVSTRTKRRPCRPWCCPSGTAPWHWWSWRRRGRRALATVAAPAPYRSNGDKGQWGSGSWRTDAPVQMSAGGIVGSDVVVVVAGAVPFHAPSWGGAGALSLTLRRRRVALRWPVLGRRRTG